MITSTQNPRIQHIRRLMDSSRYRREAKSFVIEGLRLVEEALTQHWQIHHLVISENPSSRVTAVAQAAQQAGIEILEISQVVLKAVSDTQHSQGILAVVQRNTLPLPKMSDFFLIADTLRDPGNLGAILRTAAAAGVHAVYLSPGCVDPFSPKVVRAGMGAHFRLSLQFAAWEEMRVLFKPAGKPIIPIYSADAHGTTNLWETDFTNSCGIMIGSEAEGLSPQGITLADKKVMIPMPGKMESLNAAVATSILLYEVVRQRMIKK